MGEKQTYTVLRSPQKYADEIVRLRAELAEAREALRRARAFIDRGA